MPILDSQIEVFRLCVRINRLRYEIVRNYRMTKTPFLQGLTKAMDMMEHDLEADAKALTDKIGTVRARGKTAMTKGHQRIDATAGRVDDVEKFVTTLEGSNGGDPLDGSSNTSEQQTDIAAQPEQLTVNGVSKS